jgi:Uma2 family endonuclease
MVATLNQEKAILPVNIPTKNGNGTVLNVPKSLIYDEFGGRVYYRKGYKNVLNQTKTKEDIMGTSSLQGTIISVLLSYLYRNVEDDGYVIITNEAGLHIALGENLSADIILYEQEDFLKYRIDEHYFNVAPKIVIEVDIKIELENQTAMQYVTEKTEALLKFGVEHVIWVFSKERIVVYKTPNTDFIISDWRKDFELLPNHVLNIQKMIEKRGYQFDF